MPPKVKITKESIIDTAFNAVRRNGESSLNARNIASILNCSTQPIFSNFESMQELYLSVVKRADQLCNEYIHQEIKSEKYPPYKASGMAYIRFAKEEKELFKLLYMRDRSNEIINDEDSEINELMQSFVYLNTGLLGDNGKLFHLEMWAFVHGIATMFATGYLNLEWELVSSIITDAYQGIKNRFKKD